MKKRLKETMLSFFMYESSAYKLALASSLAIYIAFCPFIGFHILMSFGLGWFFNLNIPVILAVGCGINNPLTMVPVYSSGYFFGHWILHHMLHIPVHLSNPWWMNSINKFLMQLIGTPQVSLWAFMIGGNVLGIAFSLIAFPFLYRAFSTLSVINQ